MPDPIPPSNSAMAVAASALKAQQSRMRVIAEHIANAQSTARTPGGEPYRRQIPVFQAREVDGATGVTLAGPVTPAPGLLPWSRQIAIREGWLRTRHEMLLPMMRLTGRRRMRSGFIR